MSTFIKGIVTVGCFIAIACSPLFANAETFTYQLTKKSLKTLDQPVDFVTVIYGLALSNFFDLNHHANFNQALSKLVFSKQLLAGYEKVDKLDSKLNELGCFETDLLFNAQDMEPGIWINREAINTTDTTAIVPISFVQDQKLTKPHIMIELIKENGWKINDIIYADSHANDPSYKSLAARINYCLEHQQEIYGHR